MKRKITWILIKQQNFKKIHKFNISNSKQLNITLNKLYNRFGSTKNDLKIKKTFSKKSIVIVEGHYSGYNEIYNYLDYNILLLADKHELLKRKIDRVKNYRDPKETAKYFELIDVPSFINYLTRFGNNYNMIVDNSNYFQPVIKNKNYIQEWIKGNIKLTKKILSYGNLIDEFNVFYDLNKKFKKEKLFKKVFNCIVEIDNFVNKNFVLSLNNIKSGLFDYSNSIIKKTNKKT